MTTLGSTLAEMTTPRPPVRRIGEADLNWSLAQGWSDFKAKRGDVIVLALIYPIVGLVAATWAFDVQLRPMVFPLVAGLSLLGPAVASGFYELARRREAGLESSWIHFLDPLRGRSRTSLAVLTLGSLLLFAAWLLVASAIFNATLGAKPETMMGFASRVFTTPQGWALILFGNLAGLVFAVLTLGLTLVSFPMVVDKSVDAVTAVSTSVQAVVENPQTAASWGLKVIGLLVLGCLPLFIGLAVVLPVLGYASWHLYTRIVER